jgi:hypothetical protein
VVANYCPLMPGKFSWVLVLKGAREPKWGVLPRLSHGYILLVFFALIAIEHIYL